MRRKEHYWTLFHVSEKNQLDDLRTDQVEAIFAAIPPAQKKEWLIWKEGFASWKPFEEFPTLLIGLRSTREEAVVPPPPIPAREPVRFSPQQPASPQPTSSQPASSNKFVPKTAIAVFEPETLMTADGLALDEHMGEDGRSLQRYSKRLEARIHLPTGLMVTQTENISMAGMRLRDDIPAGAPAKFNVELRLGGELLPLQCSPVRDGLKATNRLHIDTNLNPKVLFAWLVSD